jgi:glyoxylase-like metal-dependent hydrolase (beta-lactamase superfamily II)
MIRRHAWAVVTLSVLAACKSAPPEQQVIDDAAAALGGRDRLLAVKTLTLEGGGTNGNLGQDMTPEATGQTFTVSNYRRAISFAANASRTEQTRTPNFVYFQGRQPQRLVNGFDGDVGYNVGGNGAAARVSAEVTRDRRTELFHHPVGIVRAALEPGAELSNAHTSGQERAVDIKTQTGLTLTLAIDGTTHLPTRVVSMADNVNLGDVAIETSFADYQDVSGLKLPAHITTKTDRWMTSDITLTKQSVDGESGDLAAPTDANASRVPAQFPEAVIDDQEIAKGVWLLAGQSHHSVVVEFADHLTLIEAPQHDTRTLAVIEKARTLRPGKPLTQVVNTHHHFDHSGGVRAAVSEGLTVITHKGNVAFFEDVTKRSHTLVPDALARKPQSLRTEAVDDTLELKDKTRTLQLFHIIGSPHTDTMVMAYLPQEKMLIEVDVFTPGGLPLYAPNLLENVKQRGLVVNQIVPLHGVMAPFAELQKAAQAVPTN